jgi:hypothetical protein
LLLQDECDRETAIDPVGVSLLAIAIWQAIKIPRTEEYGGFFMPEEN